MAKAITQPIRPHTRTPTEPRQPMQPSPPPEMSGELVRILKASACPTLSGRGQLTYNVGIDSAGTVYFRIATNPGGGFFSTEWVALPAIHNAIDERYEGSPITAHSLTPLFRGKSVNTPAFLLAVLRAEKLLQPMVGRPRCQEATDPTAFMAGIRKLAASKVNLPDEIKPKDRSRTPSAPTPKATPVVGKQKPGRKPSPRK